MTRRQSLPQHGSGEGLAPSPFAAAKRNLDSDQEEALFHQFCFSFRKENSYSPCCDLALTFKGQSLTRWRHADLRPEDRSGCTDEGAYCWPAKLHETVVVLNTVAFELRQVRSKAPISASGLVVVVVPVPSHDESLESKFAFTR